MSTVTREELQTILLFGVHVAKLDNEIHPLENEILRRFADAIHLSGKERADLLAAKFSLGHGLSLLSSDAARNLLVKTMCAVASVDGTIAEAEKDFIGRVVTKFEKPTFILPAEDWPQYQDELFQDLEALT
jgi:uncharacterized tellurite resistance protein B-like protein